MEGLLLIIALLAISIHRYYLFSVDKKEIGTYIALGITRAQVVGFLP